MVLGRVIHSEEVVMLMVWSHASSLSVTVVRTYGVSADKITCLLPEQTEFRQSFVAHRNVSGPREVSVCLLWFFFGCTSQFLVNRSQSADIPTIVVLTWVWISAARPASTRRFPMST